MRELIRMTWPLILAAVLGALLFLLTLISRGAPRDSWRHRTRVSLLAAMLSVMGVGALPACEAEDAGRVPVLGSLDVVDAQAEAEEPELNATCYADTGPLDESPEVNTTEETPEVVVMCYYDSGPLDEGPEAYGPDDSEEVHSVEDTSEVESDDEEILMCYDPAIPDDEPEVIQPDAQDDAGDDGFDEPTDAG
jgi:hypothetical protein